MNVFPTSSLSQKHPEMEMTATRLRSTSCGMIIALLCCIVGPTRIATASCGDHLVTSANPVSIKHTGDLTLPKHVPVRCNGPRCQRAPEKPTPAHTPAVEARATELFVQIEAPEFVLTDGIEFRWREFEFADLTRFSQRLERPPRTGPPNLVKMPHAKTVD